MKAFITSLLILGSILAALACGPFERGYLANQYMMFRVIEPGRSAERTYESGANCVAWQKATSKENTIPDINNVVYAWPLDSILKLEKNMRYSGNNTFAKWLVLNRDTAALKLLELAKRSASAVGRQYTRWYYFVEGDKPSQLLGEVLTEAKAYKGSKYADRYALQVLRCLKAMRQYEKCVAYWDNNASKFHPGIVRDMAADYAAGAAQLTGQNDKAADIYAKYLPDRLPRIKDDEMFGRLALRLPDSPDVMDYLQRRVRGIECNESGSEEPIQHQSIKTQLATEYTGWIERQMKENKQEYQKLYSLVIPVVKNGKGREIARWNYAAAFLADKIGHHKEAMRYAGKAYRNANDSALRADARILRIYIAAANTDRYDKTFEDYLSRELRWLDGVITSGLTNDVRNKYAREGMGSHICGWSIYYPADMMRKILIGRVAPLCYRSGQPVRALQYLNYADNAIFKKVPQLIQTKYIYDTKTGETKEKTTKMSVADFRSIRKDTVSHRGADEYDYDYACDYFINLDSVSADNVIALSKRIETPRSSFDRFLNAGSYTDPRYLYDIIGTKLIFEGRYKEAVGWLKKVNPQFQQTRHVSKYFDRDPFGYKGRGKTDPLYKLHFARRMAGLEKQIREAKDPNRRADLMLLYSIGMQNSVGERAWPLTSYYWGAMYRRALYSQHRWNGILATIAKAGRIRKQALALYTNNESAAKAYALLGKQRTAATRYPNTKTAAHLRRVCDKLYDYTYHPVILPPAMWSYE